MLDGSAAINLLQKSIDLIELSFLLGNLWLYIYIDPYHIMIYDTNIKVFHMSDTEIYIYTSIIKNH